MRLKGSCTILFIFFLLLMPLNGVKGYITYDQDTDLTNILDDLELDVYDKDESMNGLNVFVLWERDETIPTWIRSVMIVMNMEGTIIASHEVSDGTNLIYETQMFNASTVLYLTSGDDIPHLWNFETDIVENLNFPSGHHDIEYNILTDTFLVKQFMVKGEYQGLEIQYHDLYEYDRNGNELWYWNSTKYFPFNSDNWLGETFLGQIQYVHANSIFWEIENDKIYYNSKNLDTFYRIDKSTGKIDWGIGRLGNYTLLNQKGNEVDSLWYHAHALEKIAPDRFILYDNDSMNRSRHDPSSPGITRIVEIKINEELQLAQEVWSYAFPADDYSPVWGDADRLPNGNSLASLGHFSHSAYLAEVNLVGEIVWQVTFQKSITRSWGIFSVERLLEQPLVKVSTSINNDNEMLLELNVWNSIRTRGHVNGRVTITQEEKIIFTEAFRFNPNWEKTQLNYIINNPEIGELMVMITDNEGLMTEISVFNDEKTETGNTPFEFLIMFPTIWILTNAMQKKKRD